MTPILTYSLSIALAVVGLALILAIIRLLIGPSTPDRVVALDLITLQIVGLIAIYSIYTDHPEFLTDAIVLAVVSFLATIAFASYVGKGGVP